MVVVVFLFYLQEPLCIRNVKETRNKGSVFPVNTDRPTRNTPMGWTAVCPAHTAAQVMRVVQHLISLYIIYYIVLLLFCNRMKAIVCLLYLGNLAFCNEYQQQITKWCYLAKIDKYFISFIKRIAFISSKCLTAVLNWDNTILWSLCAVQVSVMWQSTNGGVQLEITVSVWSTLPNLEIHIPMASKNKLHIV